MTASIVACSAGSTGPGIGDGGALPTDDAGTSADGSVTQIDGASDASTKLPPSPAAACAPVLDARGGCSMAIGQNPPISGGTPPDGVYDRKQIYTPIKQPDSSCSSSEISFDQGTFQLTFHDLGGPFVSGGKVTFDAARKTMKVDVACGDALGQTEYSYSYDPAKESFTLFYGTVSKTAWVYEKR